jgi:hypothetical protein
MAKETVDVEKVVEWAYRVQCVDRQIGLHAAASQLNSVSGGIGEFLRLGTRVDKSGIAANVLGVRLPDDASIVHDAVLALADTYIEWKARDEVDVWDAESAAAAGEVLTRHGDGVTIAPAYEPGGTPPSAPRQLEVVSSTVLVVLNGRTGSRPEWHPDWRPTTRGAAGAADRRDVMHARAVYLAWRLALCRLQARLAGSLADFDVTGPEAPAAPWLLKRPCVVEEISPAKTKRPLRGRKRA